MILDERLEFADNVPVAMTVGNSLMPHSDVIDLGAVPIVRDLGAGEPIYIVFQPEVNFAGGTNAHIRYQLMSSSDPTLATGRVIHFETPYAAVSSFTISAPRIYTLPAENAYRRYLGLWVFVFNADVTAGRVSVFLTNQPNRFVHYPDAI